MTLTLVGDVLLSLVLTNWADHFGRRRITKLGSGLMVASGIVFALASNYWVLLAAAVFGVISPSGNEIGPFRAVEEGMLASLSVDHDMSDIFAWHIVAGTLGVSFGTFSAGWIMVALQKLLSWTEQRSYRGIFVLYAIIGMAKLVVATVLSDASELPKKSEERDSAHREEAQAMLQAEATAPAVTPSVGAWQRIWQVFIPTFSPSTRSILWKLCLLFAIDSFASGMVAFTLISFYLHSRFETSMSLLSSLLAIPFVLSAISSLLASPISKKLGLLPTMALTHLPSAIFLGLLPLAPTIELACALLILRAALSTMDQGPRAVFLAQAVRPEERTKVMGVVNTVKTMAQSGGPTVTGLLAQGGHFGSVFVLGGTLKAIYDLSLIGLWLSGRARKEPTDFALQARHETEENDSQVDSPTSVLEDGSAK
ncbi:hypothetical protein H2200_008587 [Cladophialophora chaetospira]|uniref:Major facilitator superfamily (MFS) profile domain-containing protein n=1 Tax=Cladophialophora chaetospira TaxID=386627 RepID=A0AA39CFQ3_9EURO|nr:hypothetical protein H2200_008587 [Cladophialophora chaetospira]